MTTYNTGNSIGSADPRDLYDNAENLDEAVNSGNFTFVDRLGQSRLTLKGYESAAGSGDVSIQAAAAALADADRAETQADRAETQADRAEQEVAGGIVQGVSQVTGFAQQQADRAEVAANASVQNADLYGSTAAGLSATSDGEQFQTLYQGDYVRWLNDGGSAVEVGRFPTAAAAKASFGVMMPLDPENISFDTADNELVLSGTIRMIRTTGVTGALPAATIPMPTGNGVYRIMYRPSSSDYVISEAHASGFSVNDVFIGGFRRSGSRLYIYGIGECVIDGIHRNEYDSIAPSDVTRGEFFATQGDAVNYDSASRTLEFPVGRVYHGRTNTPISSPVSVSLPDLRGRLFFDPSSREITAVSATLGGSQPPAGMIQIGLYDRSSSGRFFDIAGAVSIDGAALDAPDRGELLPSEAESLDFRLGINQAGDRVINQMVIVANRVRLWFGKQNRLLPGHVVDLSDAVDTLCNLVYNLPSGEIRTESTSTSNSIATGDVVVGQIYIDRSGGTPATPRIYGIGRYSINGVDASVHRSDIARAPVVVVNGNTDASYEQPALSGFEWISTAVYGDVYALYDSLVTQYPEYVTRTLLGNDSLDNPIYRYDFTPPTFIGGVASTAKMILTAGHHGYEKAGIYVTYAAMKEICDRWDQVGQLETLRWGVHFIVIPIVCPWGFDNNSRVNENGVDPSRNYPSGWNGGDSDPASGQYRGPYPLSEPACQYVDQVMFENRDAVYFCSFHNMQSDTIFIWNASDTLFGRDLANRLSARLTLSWAKRYAWATAGDWLGYSNLTAPNGSEGRQATRAHGIQGGTFEISRHATAATGDETLWGADVATLGTEAFINWLLLNLEYGAQLKNSSIRLPGA